MNQNLEFARELQKQIQGIAAGVGVLTFILLHSILNLCKILPAFMRNPTKLSDGERQVGRIVEPEIGGIQHSGLARSTRDPHASVCLKDCSKQTNSPAERCKRLDGRRDHIPRRIWKPYLDLGRHVRLRYLITLL